MSESDFLRRACACETADEQAALHDEIYREVIAEREAAGLPENRIQASAEAMRRLREEVRRGTK